MSAISANIDRLRNLDPVEKKTPTVAQLVSLARDIYDCVSLEETVARPELDGFSAADLCSVAEEFGKFRARSGKGGPKVKTVTLEELGILIGIGRDEVLERSRLRMVGGKLRNRWRRSYLVPPELLGDPPAVIIPAGYDPYALGRNIRASLAALVITMPSMEETERFWARRYATPVAELTAEHVCMLWWLAAHDLGGKLDELDAESSYISGLLVKAHDLLETHRVNSVEAVRFLIGAKAYERDVAQLADAVTTASWANPGLFGRVSSVLDALVDDPGNDRVRRVLDSRLGSVARWATSGAAMLADVKYLNEAHVMMLCERSGLATDAGEERKVREQIRAKLTSLGLVADLDQELPAGVAAWRMGRLEEFYDSREARANGVENWQDLFSVDEDAELV